MDADDVFVDDEGRLMWRGKEVHGCCLEAAAGPHGDCDLSQFIDLPPAAPPRRTFIPHKPKTQSPKGSPSVT